MNEEPEEPVRRKYDRAYREKHKERLNEVARVKRADERARLKEYERKYGK